MKNQIKFAILGLMLFTLNVQLIKAQKVEVQGELKVSEMTANESGENLVIRKEDGTLGTRSVTSLPPPPPAIDTSRNLASDFSLAKQLCDCPNLPPFMINKLLESGYTQEELVGSGINVQDVIDAQRNGTLIDARDNKSYKTVKIGTQVWMAENLNFGTRIDGIDVPSNNSIVEKYCYEDIESSCNTYGGLYQWEEMMDYEATEAVQGICPAGWHLPTDNEWKTLEMELGMSPEQANNVNSRGTDQGSQLSGNESLWPQFALAQNGVFGSSGFNASPGGSRLTTGLFESQSINAFFWTSSSTTVRGWSRNLEFRSPEISRFNYDKVFGLSVRCMKD